MLGNLIWISLLMIFILPTSVSAATCSSLGGNCQSSCLTVDLIRGASDCGWFTSCCKVAQTPAGGGCTGTGANAGKTGRCGTYCGKDIIDNARCTTANGPAMNGLFCCIGQTVSSAPATAPMDIPADTSVAGTTEAGGVIKCGRGGQQMCTLCDLIKGFNDIIQYIMRIAVVVVLAMLTIGGGMYVISVGNDDMIKMAKNAMKNAGIGLAVILLAWLMINTLLFVIGTKSNVSSSWGNFQCTAGAKNAL